MANKIEQEDSLEESLDIFVKSVELASECMQTLNDCKGKLVILQDKMKEMEDANG